MICSTIYRSILSLVGAVVVTLGTFSMLQASVHRTIAIESAKANGTQPSVLRSATMGSWQQASNEQRVGKSGV